MPATKAAVEEGIVPGGGVALMLSSEVLQQLKVEGGVLVGVKIVTRGIDAPMRWTATIAIDEGATPKWTARVQSEEGITLTDGPPQEKHLTTSDPRERHSQGVESLVSHSRHTARPPKQGE